MSTLDKIKFTNFRNLSEQVISLKPSINCIFGENGNGKTNVLEAIHLSINKKSFRKKAGFQQVLSVDCEKPEIISSITLKNQNGIDYYSICWDQDNFSCLKNNEIKKRKPDTNCVFISPFDSFSFHNESTFRRSSIDSFISRFDNLYKKTISDYSKLLKQKNHVLKFSKDVRYLDATDKVLAEKINIINSRRLNFIDEINPYLGHIYQEIFSEHVELKLELNSVFNNLSTNECYLKLLENRKIDLESRISKIGPNRDEIQLKFNGFDSVEFCSLGQQKTAYLSLLFAYIKLFGYKIRVFPIVLIDDVSGELDSIRLDLLIKYLFNANYQVVLTTANNEFKNKLEVLGNINLINVKDGYFH